MSRSHLQRTGLPKGVLSAAVFLWCTPGCVEPSAPSSLRMEFRNVLDPLPAPLSPEDLSAFALSDLGSWQMFGMNEAPTAGFTGPLILHGPARWVGTGLATLEVSVHGESVTWVRRTEGERSGAYPGLLREVLVGPFGLEAEVLLWYTSAQTAMVRATLSNRGSESIELIPAWKGRAEWINADPTIAIGGVGVAHPESGASVVVRLSEQPNIVEESEDPGLGYRASYSTIELSPGESAHWSATMSVFADGDEGLRSLRAAEVAWEDAGPSLIENEERWSGYLSAALEALPPTASSEERRLAVKAVTTLISNWRVPQGDLRHDGLFPSFAYRGFHGIWSWDSWKHARALAHFAPELAKDQVRVMLVRQNSAGMIPDVIYADSTQDNWRDTKPPLAAWAVHEIFESTGDVDFVREVYPILIRYHDWWRQDRDHDGNGLSEYGSTDGTRIAAAWESGMDNAVRFDTSVMLQSGSYAWSTDQESVDLNAYLFAEKHFLAELAEAIGAGEDAIRLRGEADDLGVLIRTLMWSEESGFFHDRRLGAPTTVPADAESLVQVAGPEGWIPLWAGVATSDQAARVAQAMMDPARFNGPVPLPTLDMSRPEFDPSDGYWRGPVWLDQAYFGVAGLERYGLDAEADVLRGKLLEGPAGLLGAQPIYENYDPRTGEGLNARHFSWSAAHILMLLWGI